MDRIWSSDGQYIAFICRKVTLLEKLVSSIGQTSDGEFPYSPNRIELCVIDKNQAVLENLTDNGFSEYSPAWIPTKNQLSYISNKDDKPNLYVIDIGNKLSRKIDGSEFVVGYSWSPKGNQVAIISMYRNDMPGQMEMSIIDFNGNVIRVIPDEDLFSVSWSPDEQRIAYITGSWPDDCDLNVFNKYTMDTMTLPISTVCADITAWSKDGTLLGLSRCIE